MQTTFITVLPVSFSTNSRIKRSYTFPACRYIEEMIAFLENFFYTNGSSHIHTAHVEYLHVNNTENSSSLKEQEFLRDGVQGYRKKLP